jgi:hypothetical protein
MISLVTDGATGEPRGVHVTFLADDGPGTALIKPDKMTFGRIKGGVIRLTKPVRSSSEVDAAYTNGPPGSS